MVIESQTAGIIMVGYILDEFNSSDLLTNTTMVGNFRNGMVDNIFNNKDAALNKYDLVKSGLSSGIYF